MRSTGSIFQRFVSGFLAFAMLLSFVPVFDLTALLPKASAAETDEDLSAAPCNVANRAYMDGVYIIHSAADPDLVLDIAGNTTGNGDAAFELDLADGSDTQRFVFQLDEKITGSKVYGLRAITSKRWMTKQSDSTVSLNFWGQQTIETSGINTIQQFVIQKSDGGFYTIVNVKTGNYLGISGDGIVDSGISSSENPTNAQRWIIYCDALTGKQLTAQGDSGNVLTDNAVYIQNMGNIRGQMWYLKDVRSHPENVQKGDNQNISTGVISYSIGTYVLSCINKNTAEADMAKAAAVYGYHADQVLN